MKIKVQDILPNPFRRIKQYPFDREKIERLKISINETSFWDNILVRPHPTKEGKYQLAYGHHRLMALRNLNVKEIDIPVRDLSDSHMIKIMANENLEWLTSPKVINETVLAVKTYLDGELAKAESFDALNKSIKGFTDKEHFHQLKKDGVGQTTILKFLGDNWKQWVIQEALDTIRQSEEGKIDKQAVEMIPSLHAASEFKKEIKNKNISVDKQRSIAKAIADDDVGYRDVKKYVKRLSEPEIKKSDDFYKAECLIDDIKTNSTKLLGNIHDLKNLLNKMNVTEVKGLKVFEAVQAIKLLKGSFSEMSNFKGK